MRFASLKFFLRHFLLILLNQFNFKKESLRPGLNRRPLPYQGSALPLSYVGTSSGWWESNSHYQLGRLEFYHWTTPAMWGQKDSNLRRHTSADLQSAAFDRSAMSPMWLLSISTHTKLHLSRRRDSNPRPADYKSAALPTELHRQVGFNSHLLMQ